MGYVRSGNPPRTGTGEQIYPPTGEAPRARRAPASTPDERRTVRIFAGGTSIETLGGLTAVVLAVIGVTGFQQIYMLGAACIATGLALLAHGGSIAARWNEVLRRLDGERFDRSELVGGIGTEVFGGAVGLILGVLALANVRPFVMLPVAAIVFGGSLLLGGAAQPELEALVPDYETRYRRFTHDAIQASGGVMVMVGIAAAVLGILALLDVGPVLTLTLVGMLCIGAALFMAGGALTARFARRFT
jgi:hypothetical protein